MGSLISRAMKGLFGSHEYRILMLGLDAAGKTTVLYKLKMGEQVHTIPTIGFNCETVQFRNITFTMWDVGGQNKIRTMWHHYLTGNNALIYVVDSNDPERIDESSEELARILASEEMKGAAVLLLANKQDIPGALSVSQIVDKMNMDRFRGRKWFAQGCCATNGDGLTEGLEWLSKNIKAE